MERITSRNMPKNSRVYPLLQKEIDTFEDYRFICEALLADAEDETIIFKGAQCKRIDRILKEAHDKLQRPLRDAYSLERLALHMLLNPYERKHIIARRRAREESNKVCEQLQQQLLEGRKLIAEYDNCEPSDEICRKRERLVCTRRMKNRPRCAAEAA